MIKFQEHVELEVTVSFDEKTETVETVNAVFKKGDMVDADVIDINENFDTCTLQFADGSVAYGVPMKIFGVMGVGNPTRGEGNLQSPFDDPAKHHQSFA